MLTHCQRIHMGVMPWDVFFVVILYRLYRVLYNTEQLNNMSLCVGVSWKIDVCSFACSHWREGWCVAELCYVFGKRCKGHRSGAHRCVVPWGASYGASGRQFQFGASGRQLQCDTSGCMHDEGCLWNVLLKSVFLDYGNDRQPATSSWLFLYAVLKL